MGRKQTEETKEKLSQRLREHWENNPPPEYSYKCQNCGIGFSQTTKIRKDRKAHCDNCKRKVVHSKNLSSIESILELSTRTVQKIIKRANVGCSICGWNNATCDVHHIVHKKDGGTDEHHNLIIVCPNHHRDIHANPQKYDMKHLKSLSLVETFSDWKEFYNQKN